MTATHESPVNLTHQDDLAFLSVRSVSKSFKPSTGLFRSGRVVHAVSEVSIDLRRGETVGLVGESGSGKSTLGRLVLMLHRPDSGQIYFDGVDLASMDPRRLREFRSRIQIVFQDTSQSVDPRMTVREIVREPLDVLRQVPKTERDDKVMRVLDDVGLGQRYLTRLPHQLSGGERQRVAIARALVTGPELLVLDEPVTALDVSVQAQILNLLVRLQAERGLTYLFVGHDLGVIRHLCDRVAVMYAGKIVETGPGEKFFDAPRHPYSTALLSAVPLPDPRLERQRERAVLKVKDPGGVPGTAQVSACPFAERCWKADDVCRTVDPFQLPQPDDDRFVACHYPEFPERKRT